MGTQKYDAIWCCIRRLFHSITDCYCQSPPFTLAVVRYGSASYLLDGRELLPEIECLLPIVH